MQAKLKLCPVCEGEGYCLNCDGTGMENDRPGETPVPCEDCRSTGDCHVCNGSGYISVTPEFIVTQHDVYVQVELEDRR